MSFKPSVYQQAIFDEIKNGKGSMLIEAVAGSGKTTTIINSLQYIPTTKKVVILAFNKSIATELEKRVPKHVIAKTCHSVGFGSLMKFLGSRVRVDGRKTWNILNYLKDRKVITKQEVKIYGSFVYGLVSKAKNIGLGTKICPNDDSAWYDLISHHGLFLTAGKKREAIRIANLVLNQSNVDRNQIDFDDMLYLPIYHDLNFPKFDYVFIDEAQDTNLLQAEVLKKLSNKTTRVVLVGDPRQAIYGFRGADANALENLSSSFNASKFPLSVSYRCAKEIVKEAQEHCDYILPSDTAPDGIVRELLQYDVSDFSSKDAIVCRNIAPLVKMAYSMIARGIGINFPGRDFGKGLISLIEKLKSKTIKDLREDLLTWRDEEIEFYTSKNEEDKIAAVHEKYDCLNIFIEHLPSDNKTINGLTFAISELFSENSNNITLCSIHKSKGMEWDKVFILHRELIPSKWSKQDWQVQQEYNLMYVAITRAKNELVYITTDNWKNS